MDKEVLFINLHCTEFCYAECVLGPAPHFTFLTSLCPLHEEGAQRGTVTGWVGSRDQGAAEEAVKTAQSLHCVVGTPIPYSPYPNSLPWLESFEKLFNNFLSW